MFTKLLTFFAGKNQKLSGRT